MAQSAFDKLAAKLAQQQGVSDPKALASVIGRRKFGAPTMAKAAARGVSVKTVKRDGY